MNDFLFVYCTCSTLIEAKNIAKTCVEKRLAACANIIPKMHSLYWWNDTIEESDEVVLLFKTHKSKFELLQNEIVSIHSYQVPCVVALPINNGLDSYLGWIKEETKSK